MNCSDPRSHEHGQLHLPSHIGTQTQPCRSHNTVRHSNRHLLDRISGTCLSNKINTKLTCHFSVSHSAHSSRLPSPLSSRFTVAHLSCLPLPPSSRFTVAHLSRLPSPPSSCFMVAHSSHL